MVISKATKNPTIPIQVPSHSPTVWIKCAKTGVATKSSPSIEVEATLDFLSHHN